MPRKQNPSIESVPIQHKIDVLLMNPTTTVEPANRGIMASWVGTNSMTVAVDSVV
jgi:hypothetical protein